jgi:NADPH2 dehydrogenase
MTGDYSRPGSFRSAEAFLAHATALGVALPFHLPAGAVEGTPLAMPLKLASGRMVGNRFCTLPMEGWDGTAEGHPTDHTIRRWSNFGRSGAKLIWGGEAVAVRPEGRGNPNQLMINQATAKSLERLRGTVVTTHLEHFSTTTDLIIGIQLTHSGRFSRPNRNDKLEPIIAYHHPVLDRVVGIEASHTVISDIELDCLVEDFVRAAKLAQEAGFDFVDIKHCHGYLGHELLSARTRPGPYGGDLPNRARFVTEVSRGIHRDCPGLEIGVRLSAFDFPPFAYYPSEGVSRQVNYQDGPQASFCPFGVDPQDPLVPTLHETFQFVERLQELGIQLLCVTAGNPYYCYHVQRPAGYPALGTYPPPEDPLVGVARQIRATAELKQRFPAMVVVGSAYTYLQEWIPPVAHQVLAEGMADFVGLGRMMLSYPEFPRDVLSGKPLDRRRICRTFSDCTSAPRMGLISGCFPLDPYYAGHSDHEKLKRQKLAKKGI